MSKQYKKPDWDADPEFASYKKELFKGGKAMPRCYESHPVLQIGDYQIEGGSCSYPMVKDADVYIGFDWTMKLTPPPYPWAEPKPLDHVEVYFNIPDGGVPSNKEDFKKLVEWTAEQLEAGKKVHVGCIGGHGRTGMFLAALVTYMTGNKDSIQYVRDAYCKKAVETTVQMTFLQKNFGITPREGSKAYLANPKEVPYVGSSSTNVTPFSMPSSGSKKAITPVSSTKNIFRAPASKV